MNINDFNKAIFAHDFQDYRYGDRLIREKDYFETAQKNITSKHLFLLHDIPGYPDYVRVSASNFFELKTEYTSTVLRSEALFTKMFFLGQGLASDHKLSS